MPRNEFVPHCFFNICVVSCDFAAVLKYSGRLYAETLLTLRSVDIGLLPGFAYLSGVILLLILAVIFICALPFIRRNGYFEVIGCNVCIIQATSIARHSRNACVTCVFLFSVPKIYFGQVKCQLTSCYLAGVLLHAPAVRVLLDLSHSPRTDILDVFPSTRTSSPAGEVDPVHQKQT